MRVKTERNCKIQMIRIGILIPSMGALIKLKPGRVVVVPMLLVSPVPESPNFGYHTGAKRIPSRRDWILV